MKLNNKGFAVSAILYSVLVLFLLVLVSFLGLLSSQRNYILKSNESILKSMHEETITINRYIYNGSSELYLTPYRGNYLIIASGKQGYIYLPKNTIIQASGNNIKFDEKVVVNMANQNANETKYVFHNVQNSEVLSNQIKVVSVNTSKNSVSENSKDFLFNYGVQNYEVENTGYYKIELWGAQAMPLATDPSQVGAKGAYTSGIIELQQGDILYFYVGGRNDMGTMFCSYSMDMIPNGYIDSEDGNATGYIDMPRNCSEIYHSFNGGDSSDGGSAGGGATDVRLVSGTWSDTSSLISRIMVAGGGGTGLTPGSGGTLKGNDGTTNNLSSTGNPSTGGSQTGGGSGNAVYSAGTFGKGGNGCGGGGGYYGGGGSLCAAGGSGGSSYISGFAGVNSVNNNATTVSHNNNTIHYSGKYFIKGEMKAGVNEGDGKARITYMGSKPKRVNNLLNGVRYIKDCTRGNTINGYSHWHEIQAIYQGRNIAKGKIPTANFDMRYCLHSDNPDCNPTYPQTITDGYTYDSTYYVSNPTPYSLNQCVTIDLGQEYDLDEVAVWHIHGMNIYSNNITSAAGNDNVYRTLIQKEAAETIDGKRVNAYSN